MKKGILALLCIIFTIPSSLYAAPSFTEPTLSRAYNEVQKRIQEKSQKIVLDENAKLLLGKKQESLTEALTELDSAWQKKDKGAIRNYIGLFRERYKDIMRFLGGVWAVPSATRNQATITTASMPIVNTNGTETADITYYADSFEGGKTSNGNLFSQTIFSAAKCTTPFNTLIQVYSGEKSVIVKTNDRPNCTKYPNLVDLSRTAFASIGKLSKWKIIGNTISLGSVSKSYTKTYLETDTFRDLGVELSTGIPNTYLKNETIHIRGKELSGKDFTLLYLVSPSGKEISFAMKKWADGTFEQTYSLEETGNYKMVVASGLSFNTTKFMDIVVLDDSLFSNKKFSAKSTMSELPSLDIERLESSDHQGFYMIRFPSSDFYTITFSQGNNKKMYRGFGSINIPHNAMKEFNQDAPILTEVTVQKTSTTFSHDSYTEPQTVYKKSMVLTPGYIKESTENIKIKENAGNLIVQGTIQSGKNVKHEILITTPEWLVESYNLDNVYVGANGFIKPNTPFEKSIPLKTNWAYLVELNYDNGFAAYNGPIVHGEYLPLAENEYDQSKMEIATDTSNLVADSLNSINSVRNKAGKTNINIDTTLSKLANIKAQNMADHNYISHTDSFGEKIDGTAKRNNIEVASVGENIAGWNVHYNILLIGLTKSWWHRANMLWDWSKVGIGYASKNGQAYYTQVFGK